MVERKKIIKYLHIIKDLLMIIRKKDVKIFSLEMEIRELKRNEGKSTNYFH